jgi:hypothetical protein
MNLSDGFGNEEAAEAKRLFSEDRFVAIERILGRTTPDDELRYDLSYLLWKTLRNRRAGNTNFNETRGVLDRVHNAAAALISEIAPMLEHPGTNTSADDDAALLLNLANDQWDSLEIEQFAERAASLSASAMEALNKIGREKDKGRHGDTERNALVAYLSGIEYKYTGKNSRYTFDAYKANYKGTFFLLLRTFEEAVAEVLKEAPHRTPRSRGFSIAPAPASNKTKQKNRSSATYPARDYPFIVMLHNG